MESLKPHGKGLLSERIAAESVRCTTRIDVEAEDCYKLDSFLISAGTAPMNGVATQTR
jgi:hypothetical protein